MKHYLGIDGGGTKTTAAVADENGAVLYKAEGKSINFYAIGMEKSRENLKNLIEEIRNKTNIYCYTSAFIGCSALDGKADEKTTKALCDGIIDADKIGMDSDIFVALKASTGNCVAICGTGSMVIGEKSDGTIIIKGGWGHILGDEGSAYAIALCALKKCCLLDDKNTSSPILEEAKKYFKVDNLREIIDIIYSDNTKKDHIAGFASYVGALAESGDFSASAIIKNEAISFAETVKTLLQELDASPHLSLYGGVFRNNSLFKECFCNELNKTINNITIDLLTTPAEEGALKVAMEL